MFACIYFKEDRTLGVVGKNDKNLKVVSEFRAGAEVEMFWKEGGKLKLFHGEIIKVHENEEILTTYATRADTVVLKKLRKRPEIPEKAPEQLYSLHLIEEIGGKRKPKPTEKSKESVVQEETFSPKKKKSHIQGSTLDKSGTDKSSNKLKNPKPTANNVLKTDKKKAEGASVLSTEIEISAMISQLIPTDMAEKNQSESQVDSTSINEVQLENGSNSRNQTSVTPNKLTTTKSMNISDENTSLLETWKIYNVHENDEEKKTKIPVPSSRVLKFLKEFTHPEVSTFIKKVAQHFDSNDCNHEDNECFEVKDSTNHWHRSRATNTATGYHLLDISSTAAASSCNFSASNTVASNFMNTPAESNFTDTHDVSNFLNVPGPVASNFRDSPRPAASTFINTAAEGNLFQNYNYPQDIHSQQYQNVQPIPSHHFNQHGSSQLTDPNLSSPQYSRSPFDTNLKSPGTPLTNSIEATPRKSPRRSPRKSLQYSPSSEHLETQDLLLKKYPDVKVKPDKVTSAIAAARKSSKPGYTLCYNLIMGVFSQQELANSRGQGLTKPKEGDLRPILDKSKCSAVKEYTVRWCKKNEKPMPADAELNNAFTEQVSHCRKKMKKMQNKN